MTTMTETLLAPDVEGFAHLKSALMKHRSIAAEGGYLHLMTDHMVGGIKVKGLDSLACDDRTLLLLDDLAAGRRECARDLWMNLAQMVQMSTGWQILLARRGVQMPDAMEAMAQFSN